MLRQIIAPALLVIILLAVALGVTFIFMAHRIDTDSIENERRLLAAELDTKQQYIEQHVLDNAEWDETYTKTVRSFDQPWYKTTIGNLVDSISDIDAVFLIQTGGRLLHSNYSNREDTLSQHDYNHLVRSLQRNLTTRLNAAHSLRGYVTFDQGVYLVGASTVWPESPEIIEQATRDTQRNILVLLEKLDPAKLLVIEKKLKLEGLALTKDIDPDKVHHPLGVSGYLTWEPKTPGADFLADLALPMIIFTVSILVILALFWRRADKMVRLFQRADQTKSIFLSAVGHELRTPLNGITSGLALMHKADLPLNQQSYLETIERSSRELAAKVTQILDYTRLETSELELQSNSFDLRTALEEAVDGARLQWDDYGSPFALHIPSSCPTKAIGDENRIKQIVSIILSESSGTIGKGMISIDVSEQSTSAKSTTYQLVVSTTGISSFMSPGASEAFSKRSQTDDGTLSWNLATARYLAEAMGGSLSIVSDLQGRQEVHVRFVLESQNQSPTDIALPSCEGRRALIVDDETGDHLVLGAYLSDIGFVVEYAKNEQSAVKILNKASSTQYLVFVGEIIGTENGATVAGNIKHAVGDAKIDLVLMAYNPQACDISVLQNLEVASLLPRPVALGTLHQLAKDLYDSAASTHDLLAAQGENLTAKKNYKLLEDMSILIVEDNPVSRHLLSKIISRWRCTVSSAEDGDDAVTAAEHNSFDCILMDYHMPRMNGAIATKKIRELGLDLPIIILSAASDQKDIDECMNAGATAFIPKPIATPILKKKILQAFASQSSDLAADQRA